jgi:hypothetical protein
MCYGRAGLRPLAFQIPKKWIATILAVYCLFFREVGMEVLSQIGEALGMLLGAILLCFFTVWIAYEIAQALYYQGRLARELEADLGFTLDSVYLDVPDSLLPHDALCIWKLTENGVFAQAGFQVGDVLPELSETGLFKRLHRGRGKEVRIEVVDGGEGPPFVHRPRRELKFVVPQKPTQEVR